MMGKAKKKRSEVVASFLYFMQGISDCSRCQKCLCVTSDTVVYKCALTLKRGAGVALPFNGISACS